MEIYHDETDRLLPFVARDATDGKTEETSISDFVVKYAQEGDSSWTTMTTPTVTEIGNGGYHLLMDEGISGALDKDQDVGFLHFYISNTGGDIAPIHQTVTIRRRPASIAMASGVIGATGNDTTHLHLSGLAYADDDLNGNLLQVYDNSTGLWHATWITDWVASTDLATVETLPFTPEASTDRYVLLPARRDVNTVQIEGDASAVTVLQRIFSHGELSFRGTADSGTSTTLVDAAVLNGRSAQQLVGKILMINDDSLNQGHVAVITDYDDAADRITFSPAAASAITTEFYVIVPNPAVGLLDLADAVETGMTVREALRLLSSVLGGKLSGAGSGTEVFRNAVGDSKDRVTATVDSSGNRTAISTDLT